MQCEALVWDIAGIPIVIVGGTLLHFGFDFFGRRRWLALFFPVNESVWEHLKMAYWPLLVYTGAQCAVGSAQPSLPAARAMGFLVMCAAILGLYQLSVVLLPRAGMRTRLFIDGATFIVAVAAGQAVSAALCATGDRLLPVWAGLVALVLPAAVLTWTTFAPPRVRIFEDQVTGGYGVDTATRRNP